MDKAALQALLDQAKEANESQEYSTAEELAMKVIDDHASESMEKISIPALVELCLSLLQLGESNKLLEYSKLGISRTESTSTDDTQLWRAKFNNFTGNAYRQLADYPNALEFYRKSLKIFEQIGNQRGIAQSIGSIGNVYNELADYTKSLEFFQKSLDIYEQMGDQIGIAKCKGNIGNVYNKLADYTKSLEFFQKSLEIFEQIGNQRGIAISMNNIGSVYMELAEYTKALDFYRKPKEIFDQIGDQRGIANITNKIGSVYAKKEYFGYNSKKAEDYMLQALKINIELGTKYNRMDNHKTLSDLYKQTNRWQEALEQTELYYQVKEAIQSEDTKKQADRFAIEYQIQEREKEIAIERAASEAKQEATTKLLYRVLPDVIAKRMLAGEEEIADYFPNASILFADIEGFTPLTAELPAYMLVRLLNTLFNHFDASIKSHGCTKIKTIGDGYMAVAGAPESCEDHAERLVRAAIEMIKPIEIPAEIEAFLPDGAELKVRIGIHTGPIVAGVVGQEHFMYDIYSDAVNIASRMEAHGQAGRIHVSAHFMRHLLDRYAMTKVTDHGISFEKRGEIEIKGKGKMKTFFLISEIEN